MKEATPRAQAHRLKYCEALKARLCIFSLEGLCTDFPFLWTVFSVVHADAWQPTNGFAIAWDRAGAGSALDRAGAGVWSFRFSFSSIFSTEKNRFFEPWPMALAHGPWPKGQGPWPWPMAWAHGHGPMASVRGLGPWPTVNVLVLVVRSLHLVFVSISFVVVVVFV